jgi:hypothetical protein
VGLAADNSHIPVLRDIPRRSLEIPQAAWLDTESRKKGLDLTRSMVIIDFDGV